jgi:UDP-3-O-acyl N-acetylglucosamine deacetylase
MTPLRRTLINQAEVRGVGLFTGKPCTARFSPAPAGTGIIFVRADLPDSPQIPATIASLASQPPGIPARNTTLRSGSAEVLTVEHILSALTGLGISDVTISLDGPELPIGDGSAEPFVTSLWNAGIRYLALGAPPLTIREKIIVSGEGGSRITALPRSSPGCKYTYKLEYSGNAIPRQAAAFDSYSPMTEPKEIACRTYIRDVAPARTFCTKAEADAMQKSGLFKHLTARDMLVIGEGGPIDNAYRFENEPARHKLLDLIGDLTLAGRPLQVDIEAYKSGHALNHEMVKALLSAAYQ